MEAGEVGVGGFLEGVLPDADDFPALAAEFAGDPAVAGNVAFALFVPELLLSAPPSSTLRATQ